MVLLLGQEFNLFLVRNCFLKFFNPVVLAFNFVGNPGSDYGLF